MMNVKVNCVPQKKSSKKKKINQIVKRVINISVIKDRPQTIGAIRNNIFISKFQIQGKKQNNKEKKIVNKFEKKKTFQFLLE